jgi:P-type Cu2+ transporter
MPVAVFSCEAAGLPSALSAPSDIADLTGRAGASTEAGSSRLTLFDAPEEWALFSRACDEPSAPAQQLWESQLMVQGMHCAACSLTLEQSLMAIPGVLAARVSAASERASILWSSAQTRPSQWMSAPLALGYRLLPAADAFVPNHGRKEARLALWRWLVAGFCMMQVMMYAFPSYITGPGDITPDIEKLLRWASWVLSLPVLLFSCRPFFSNALRDLRQRRISMDLPVALGTAITFAVSSAATFEPQGWWSHEVYFDSLTMFVFFLLTGRWLEQRLRGRTARSLDSLMQRLPDSVERQLASGLFERVAVRRLMPGDLIRVLPGEAFPSDGRIVLGDTFADEALLTGESRPVARPIGSPVLAGSYNLSGVVHVRIEQTGQSTRYAQIVALMERAAVDKPRLALLADRVARPFLWFVLIAAALAAAFWWNTDPARALMAAVAVLIVTCPCALSLATPSAMLTSAGLLARRGVLVRRLQALEALAQIDTVIFDKTGTLTEARMGLRAVHTRDGVTGAQALQLAAALAQHSRHPVSCALVAAASQGLPAQFKLVDVQEFAGQGLQATLLASPLPACVGQLRLGSARFCNLENASQDTLPDTLQVCLADESGWLARFDLDEMVRPDAAAAITALQAAGVEVQLLSGDSQAAALRVADHVGISHAQGDSTPQSKLQRLLALQQQGRQVLMVGDGLNDGPVLAGANVSVAVGSAVALAQAQSDFLIPGGQLLMVPGLLMQARRTMRTVRQNLWWAAIYNAVCVPLALTGSLPAWLAGLGMALSSLLVIANAARLAHVPHVPRVQRVQEGG